MTIRNGKPASPGVITARKIDQHPRLRLVGPPAHAGTPLTIVDAVTALIHKHNGHHRTGAEDLTQLLIFGKSEAERVGVAAVKPTEHGDTALSRDDFALKRPVRCQARILVVTRTPPNAGAIPT